MFFVVVINLLTTNVCDFVGVSMRERAYGSYIWGMPYENITCARNKHSHDYVHEASRFVVRLVSMQRCPSMCWDESYCGMKNIIATRQRRTVERYCSAENEPDDKSGVRVCDARLYSLRSSVVDMFAGDNECLYFIFKEVIWVPAEHKYSCGNIFFLLSVLLSIAYRI